MVLEPLKDPHVVRLAQAHNRTVAQILLRHALQMGTAVIPKTLGKGGRLEENADIFDFVLTEPEMLQLNGLAHLPAAKRLNHVADLYGVHSSTESILEEL